MKGFLCTGTQVGMTLRKCTRNNLSAAFLWELKGSFPQRALFSHLTGLLLNTSEAVMGEMIKHGDRESVTTAVHEDESKSVSVATLRLPKLGPIHQREAPGC